MNRSEILFPPQHAALREDVHALGALVGEILREQGGAALLDLVEADRVLAIRRRDGNMLFNPPADTGQGTNSANESKATRRKRPRPPWTGNRFCRRATRAVCFSSGGIVE